MKVIMDGPLVGDIGLGMDVERIPTH
jgi:hypothetical protein